MFYYRKKMDSLYDVLYVKASDLYGKASVRYCSFSSAKYCTLVTSSILQCRIFNHFSALWECISPHLGDLGSPESLTHSARTPQLRSVLDHLRFLSHCFSLSFSFSVRNVPAESECLPQNWDQDIFLFVNLSILQSNRESMCHFLEWSCKAVYSINNINSNQKKNVSFTKCGRHSSFTQGNYGSVVKCILVTD